MSNRTPRRHRVLRTEYDVPSHPQPAKKRQYNEPIVRSKAGPSTAPTVPRVSKASGKLVIVFILAAAFAAAGASWWFRFNATHRAAEFWGPDVARLIRDAPQVSFFYVVNSTGDLRDPGLRDKIANVNANG